MRLGKQRYAMLTVDTEALPKRAPENHVKRLIWGEHSKGTAGVREMSKIGDEVGAKHLFFVDLCGAYAYREEIHDVIHWLDNDGQDVQLHTHPEYLPDSFWSEHDLDCRPQYMNQYDHDTRAEFVIKHFAGEISGITGKDILAFRAGSFRWNASTIRALKAAGIPLSFDNSTAAFYNEQAVFSEQTNSPYLWSNGIIEVPITEKKILPKVGKEEWWARLQFPESSYFRFRPWWGGLSFNLLSGSPDFSVFLMHSWSLLYWDENGYGVYKDDQRVEGYRKLVKKIAKDYDIITSKDFLDLHADGKIKTSHTVDLNKADITSSSELQYKKLLESNKNVLQSNQQLLESNQKVLAQLKTEVTVQQKQQGPRQPKKKDAKNPGKFRKNMHPELIDAIRDLAVQYEDVDLEGSLELMRIALKNRPHGSFLKTKVEQYELLKNKHEAGCKKQEGPKQLSNKKPDQPKQKPPEQLKVKEM